MNKQRKAKLWARATQYGKKQVDWSASLPNTRAFEQARAFNAGYRAAMRDARKAVAADIDIRQPISAINRKGAAWYLFPTIRAFLRPLR